MERITREPVHEPLTSFGFGTVQGFAPRRNSVKEKATLSAVRQGCEAVELHFGLTFFLAFY
jgi:hypothetical protein